MKIAEAFNQFMTLKNENKTLVRRLFQNVRLPEDEEPVGSVRDRFSLYEANMLRMCGLLKRLNKTNCLTEMDDGGTIMDALAKRDCLQARLRVYECAEGQCAGQARRETAKKLRGERDSLKRELDAIELYLKRVSWAVDLME
jgi:hypothetical protein